MRYLHTMVRIRDIKESLDFYVDKMGMVEVRRMDHEAGRYTLIFLAAPGDVDAARRERAPMIELTFNWDPEEYQGGRNFGPQGVDDVYSAAPQPGRDRGAVIAGSFGGRGVVHGGRIRAPGGHLVDARIGHRGQHHVVLGGQLR